MLSLIFLRNTLKQIGEKNYFSVTSNSAQELLLALYSGLVLVGSGDFLGCWGLNLGQQHAWQTLYVLYFFFIPT